MHPLPINTNSNPLRHPHRTPSRPTGQPRLRRLIEERPGRHDDQERQRRPSEPDVERVVDVLRDVACEEGEQAAEAEEDRAEGFGEGLAFEILGR